ncbi:hypothetical protein CAEBREN_12367 [Caenorhabditis brenneri]|uniref:acid phosphatase n=1 Tax=Caenorhabditis brenneri TaxID=135651 RepID=G0M7M1_CAEBE|nr:hypothetical protein CAEBREN_12367 [Caenorhabditis brenneri]
MRVLFYVLFLVIIGTVQAQLISVHVIFRHGARAPVLNVTSEEAKSYFYRGLGQLTDEGVEQAKLMGKILKDRYVNSFVDAKMLPTQLLFRSSPVERCLMTLQTVGEVMFPNATPPVQTVPKPDDFLLVPKLDCSFQLDEWGLFFNLTEEEKEKSKRNPWYISDRALRRATAQSSTLKERSNENLPALILEKEAGLAVPSWFTEEAYKESLHVFYKALSVMASVGDYQSTKGIRIKTGLLLDKIITDIQEKVRCHDKKVTSNISCDRQKLQVYSSHDLLVLPFLEALGIREEVLGKDLPPDFLAAIIIETMIIDKVPYVKVYYRKHPREITLRDVTEHVRNCPPKNPYCPAELFTSCCGEFITSDPKTECYPGVQDETRIEWVMTPVSWILAGIAIFLLASLIIMAYLVIRYKNRSVVTIKKVCLEN